MRRITSDEAIAEGWYKPNERDGYCYCGCGRKTALAPKSSPSIGVLKGESYRYCKGHKGIPKPPEGVMGNESGLCLCGCGRKTAIARKSNYEKNIVKGKPKWFIANHKAMKPDERSTTKIRSQRCEICEESKPLKRFRKDISQPSGHISVCKDCIPETENVTPQDNLMRMYITRMRNKKFLHEYVLQHACVHCEEADPVVLHFHHRDPSTKKDTVARLVHNSSSIDRIMTEIEKCDLLCANCHIKHHAPDQEWSKSSEDFYIDLPPEFHYLHQTVSEDRREVIRLVA